MLGRTRCASRDNRVHERLGVWHQAFIVELWNALVHRLDSRPGRPYAKGVERAVIWVFDQLVSDARNFDTPYLSKTRDPTEQLEDTVSALVVALQLFLKLEAQSLLLLIARLRGTRMVRTSRRQVPDLDGYVWISAL
jgi:hypothetical protein